MAAGLTRAERILLAGGFGDAVVLGAAGGAESRAAVSFARTIQANMRGLVGYQCKHVKILTSGASQHKLAKNSVKSFGLMLAPEKALMSPSRADIREAFELSGVFNVCPLASDGCAAACLNTAGQSGMPAQQRAQAVRTAFLLARPYESGLIIGAELGAALRRHAEINVRLNTTSDIRWELVAGDMLRVLSDAGAHFYDYTAWRPSDRAESDIYHLTYSAKETAHTSDDYLAGILRSGRNVAMPFDTPRGKPLPESWHGFTVIDGDESDERYRDPSGVVVGLRAKGHAWKRDNSAGFIRSSSLPLVVL